MTDEERFDEILGELRELLLDLGALSTPVMLIGGQVLAVESKRRGGTGVISVETDTGVAVERGFSFEPDLLFDMDGSGFMAERLPEVLKSRNFARTKSYRWSKTLLSGTSMDLDLFAPDDVEVDDLPTQMTRLPDSRVALRRSQSVSLPVGGKSLVILLPDAVGFLTMKERAKREQRPEKFKDSFDMFVYVKLVGAESVRAALESAGEEGRLLRARLKDLFWSRDAPGVQDVLTYASQHSTDEQELLAQAVVDLFEEL
ncbi:hypothetical protein LXT21_31510 [Myxococcus sp. K38C18041901]|uniref:hypothetical protein n=1 Tax=Myxococcus guangdongensis TaxID=2906760 RepID=UPI0020A739DC|nr:hypothetical protein [Myxococcus guangdongensis]MCP3063316.1 hypothetical protein [Myxococcus guangdongensis]